MIRLVLEDESTVLPTKVWRLRVRPGWSPFSGFRPDDEYPSQEAAEARLADLSHSLGYFTNRWLDWMEPYEVTVTRGSVSRTEVMTWPAREDFDAWVAKVKSGTKRKKERPRTVAGLSTAELTDAASVEVGISEAEASGFVSRDEWVKAALSEKKAAFRAAVLRSLARAARKREAEAGMYWEEKIP